MNHEEIAALVAGAVDIAAEAGEAILEVYAEEFEVYDKEDASPLTKADLASQRIIVEGLARLAPGVPVLAEEGAHLPHSERRTWSHSWLVDPLDGTKEFVKRNGEFTVNIALVADGRPVGGVVHAPVLDLTYYASAGRGARVRDGGGQRAISVAAPAADELKVVVSRSHANDATRRFVERLERDYRVECLSKGSSLKMCLVAEGSAHLYPRLGPTMEWDTAAAQAVVEEAGGRLVTLDGHPLGYNRAELRNPEFLACYGEADRWLELMRE